MNFIEEQFYENYLKAESELFFHSLINTMVHFANLTSQELQSAGSFLLLTDHGVFSVSDYLVITVKGDDGKLTTQQVFFNIVNVQDASNTRGVRKGYAMIKIKRTKNPFPKVAGADTSDEIEEEIAE